MEPLADVITLLRPRAIGTKVIQGAGRWASPAPQLIGTRRRRTISAREVDHGQGHEHWKAAGRRGATARVRRSGARSGREDVASAEDGGGAATAPGRGPGPGFAVARRDSRDTDRLA